MIPGGGRPAAAQYRRGGGRRQNPSRGLSGSETSSIDRGQPGNRCSNRQSGGRNQANSTGARQTGDRHSSAGRTPIRRPNQTAGTNQRSSTEGCQNQTPRSQSTNSTDNCSNHGRSQPGRGHLNKATSGRGGGATGRFQLNTSQHVSHSSTTKQRQQPRTSTKSQRTPGKPKDPPETRRDLIERLKPLLTQSLAEWPSALGGMIANEILLLSDSELADLVDNREALALKIHETVQKLDRGSAARLGNSIKDFPPEVQKLSLRNYIYGICRQTRATDVAKAIATKLTDMDNSELLDLIGRPDDLTSKLNETAQELSDKNTIFEYLYPKVEGIQEDLAWEITIMLMEMDGRKLMSLLGSIEHLEDAIADAQKELKSLVPTKRVRKVIEFSPPELQKQMIAERVHPLVVQIAPPPLVGKVTGVLLKMLNAELLSLMENRKAFRSKVQEVLATGSPSSNKSSSVVPPSQLSKSVTTNAISNDKSAQSKIEVQSEKKCHPATNIQSFNSSDSIVRPETDSIECTECNYCGLSTDDSDGEDVLYSAFASSGSQRKLSSKVHEK